MIVELSVVEQRYQAVLEVVQDGATVTDVARRHGVARHVRGHVKVLAGGQQMLGGVIEDEHGVEEAAMGLGVLPVSTRYAESKSTTRIVETFTEVGSPWSMLSGRQVAGYEIRFGQTTIDAWDEVVRVPPAISGSSTGRCSPPTCTDCSRIQMWSGQWPCFGQSRCSRCSTGLPISSNSTSISTCLMPTDVRDEVAGAAHQRSRWMTSSTPRRVVGP